MIVVDANVLLYAYTTDFPQHFRARQWVEKAFAGDESVRIPWMVTHAFLRLITGRALVSRPFSMEEGVAIVEGWFDAPAVGVVEPGPLYWPILKDLFASAQVRGDLVNDAHIAALAIENGASVCTTDRDFRRFDGLRIINPLA